MMSETPSPSPPYVGLTPFQEKDAEFFFGRTWEQKNIADNLIAYRLTLLYGPSGVGKSSILRAGVVHNVQKRKEQKTRQTPRFTVIVLNTWTQDPIESLKSSMLEKATSLSPTLPPSIFSSCTLTEALELWTELINSTLLIILDQFEEFFLYHPDETGEGSFFTEFVRAVNHPDLRVNFLIAMREDMLAHLEHFKGHLPNPFRHSIRLKHLEHEAAKKAIEGPIERFNERNKTNICIQPELVEEVVKEVEDKQNSEAEGHHPSQRGSNKLVEAPYLQLVMRRLWEEENRRWEKERSSGFSVLRLEALNALGGVGKIFEEHLERQTASLSNEERDLCALIFERLVTPSGAKYAYSVTDLAKWAKKPIEEVRPLLEKLSRGENRILNPVPDEKYEIFHDVLGKPILDWGRRHAEEHERAEAERRLEQERFEAERRLAQERAGAEMKLAQQHTEAMQQRMRRLKVSLTFIVLLALVTIGALYVAYEKQSFAMRAEMAANAERERREAQNKMLRVIERARGLTLSGNLDRASKLFTEAVQLGATVKNHILDNNTCWYGSTGGSQVAALVLPACERAVNLARDAERGWFRDSRGLARALTGNISGAIDDFEAFIEWSNDHPDHPYWGGTSRLRRVVSKREGWITELKAGENPFDEDTLAELRRE